MLGGGSGYTGGKARDGKGALMGCSGGTDPLKGRIVTAWAVFALAFGSTLFAVQLFSATPTPPVHPVGSGPSSTSGVMILASAGCVAWGYSVHLRCSDVTIRRNLKIAAALLAAWLLDVLLKYPAQNDLTTSIMWYLYYVPMLFVPTLSLSSALHAATLDRRAPWRAACRAVWAVDAALCLLVLTNNVHHLVFAFDFADPHWEGNYTYQPGYWCVTAWSLLQYAGFFAAAFSAARAQLKNAFVPVVVVLGVGVAYGVLFIARRAGLFTTNFSLIYCTLVVVALEMSLDLGILPSYTKQGRFFAKLPLDLKILSREGDVVYRTDVAIGMPDAVAATLREMEVPSRGVVSFRSSAAPSALFKVYPVAGGKALLTEDVSALDERRRLLFERQEKLRRANAMLKHEQELANTVCRQEDVRALSAEIERALESKTRRISEFLDNLPQGDDPKSAAVRRDLLMEVKLLVACCKRKGGLILAAKSDPDFNRERLDLVFNETAADLRSIGIECAALVETSDALPAALVSVLYDCLYDFAAAAFACKDPILMFFVRDAGTCAVEMRALLESGGAVSPRFQESLGELRSSLIARRAAFSLETSKSSTSFSVTLGGR